MDRPDLIDKRVFNCSQCGYSVQVYGESYFDSGCHNFMATFECPNCKVLFESLISQIDMDEETLVADHGLADEIQCLRCGNENPKIWNKESGNCPQCGSKLEYEVTGTIRVRY